MTPQHAPQLAALRRREHRFTAAPLQLLDPGRPYTECRENGMHALRHFYASVLLDAPEAAKSPLPAENPQAGGLFVLAYFFFPWFFTASIAAAAASGSRYVPPGLRGRKFSSSS